MTSLEDTTLFDTSSLVSLPNDSEFVEVSSSSLRADVFFEDDVHGGDGVSIPHAREDLVGETENDDVLHHFFPQVVIDAVDLFFAVEFAQMLGEMIGTLQILSEGFLHNQA